MKNMPTPVAEELPEYFGKAALTFANAKRDEDRAQFWCDQTPWNLLIAPSISRLVPDAVFILMLRDYRGVILSLRHSYANGYRWAGREMHESARLWSRFYNCVDSLDPLRTIAVSYDNLCARPEETVRALEDELSSRLGLDPQLFDRSVFCEKHASERNVRPTIGMRQDDRVALRSVTPYEKDRWTTLNDLACKPYVEQVDAQLRESFPNAYVPAGSHSE